MNQARFYQIFLFFHWISFTYYHTCALVPVEENTDNKLSQPWTAALSSLHKALLSWQADINSQLFAQEQSTAITLQFILMHPQRFLKTYTNSLFFPCSQRTPCTCSLLFNLDRPHYFVFFPVSHFSSFRACVSYNTEAGSTVEEMTGRMRSHEVIDEAPLEMSPRWKYECICEQEVANKNDFSHCNYGKTFLNNTTFLTRKINIQCNFLQDLHVIYPIIS